MQAIAILRGGGSADDLSCFNDEQLVREIAASRIPVITGIGHEVDESLADLAADVRASTPSNAAEMLTKNRKEELMKVLRTMNRAQQALMQSIERARVGNIDKIERVSRGLMTKFVEPMLLANRDKMSKCCQKIQSEYEKIQTVLMQKLKLLEVLNPEKVLAQGYAILAGKISPGVLIKITTFTNEIEAEVKTVKERKNDE